MPHERLWSFGLMEKLKAIFDEIIVGKPCVICFNEPYKSVSGIVIEKKKHSDYSYSLAFVSDNNCLEYLWIRPCHSHYFNKRVLGVK